MTYGRGQAVVVATGMSTEFGRISALVQTVEAGRTPLQENLDKLGRTLGKAALGRRGADRRRSVSGAALPLLDMFIFGIALAVAVVPEALPAVVTISLAIGVRRMVKRNALVRRLPVVETLGSTSVICSDKTGTLTKNEMTVRRLFVAGRVDHGVGRRLRTGRRVPRRTIDAIAPDAAILELLRAGVLASDARLRRDEGRWHIEGDPTEGALVVVAAKAALEQATPSTSIPARRRNPVQLRAAADDDAARVVRSDVGRVLERCGRRHRRTVSIWVSESERRLFTPPIANRLRGRRTEVWRATGLRVLAIARKRTRSLDDAEQHMTLLGLVGIMDPPRPEARAAVQTCQRGRHHARDDHRRSSGDRQTVASGARASSPAGGSSRATSSTR